MKKIIVSSAALLASMAFAQTFSVYPVSASRSTESAQPVESAQQVRPQAPMEPPAGAAPQQIASAIATQLAAPQTPPAAQSQAVEAQPAQSTASREITLQQFRQMFLNQRIVILKGSNIAGSLAGWEPMKRTRRGAIEHDLDHGAFIPYLYKDQTPTVIDIRENGLDPAKEGRTNAMGEVVTAAGLANPSVQMIVQFDDGRLAEYLSIPSLMLDDRISYTAHDVVLREFLFRFDSHLEAEIMLVSDRDRHAQIVEQNLPSLVGQKVYAVHNSLLFPPDVTLEELTDSLKRYRKELKDVPLLMPMTITAAKYNARYDLILWKLRLENGREVISATRYRDEASGSSFLSHSIGTLLADVPAGLTGKEIAAIREHEIFRGMTKPALFYSWGYQGQENDYGLGGKQLVYDKQYVYLDASGRITDWQSVAN